MASNTNVAAMPHGDYTYDDITDFSYTSENNKPNVSEDCYDVSDFSYSWEPTASNSCHMVPPSNNPNDQRDINFDSWLAFLRLERHKRRQLRQRFALLKSTCFFMSLKADPARAPPPPRALEPSSFAGSSSIHVHDDSCLDTRPSRPLLQCSYFDNDACSYFECNVCLNTAREPVVTSCGHVYCGPCLHRWMSYSKQKDCVVCKSELSEAMVTPIRKSVHQFNLMRSTTESEPERTSDFEDAPLN